MPLPRLTALACPQLTRPLLLQRTEKGPGGELFSIWTVRTIDAVGIHPLGCPYNRCLWHRRQTNNLATEHVSAVLSLHPLLAKTSSPVLGAPVPRSPAGQFTATKPFQVCVQVLHPSLRCLKVVFPPHIVTPLTPLTPTKGRVDCRVATVSPAAFLSSARGPAPPSGALMPAGRQPKPLYLSSKARKTSGYSEVKLYRTSSSSSHADSVQLWH